MSGAFSKLGDVAEFINGAAFKPGDWGDDGAKIIRIQNLKDPTKLYNRTKRQIPEQLHVHPGDILVSWSASLGVFEWEGPDVGLLNQHIFRVLPDEQKVDKRYLRHALELALLDMRKHLHGATMMHVNRGEFLATKLYLPPLPEQRRIAAILDQADTLRAKRREALAQLDQLTQSIFIEMFGDPVVNPKEWPIRSLASLSERIQIGPFGSQLHEEDYIDGGIPLVNPTHIKGGKIYPNWSLTVPDTKYQQLTQYHLAAGDLVIGRRGEMGRCAVIADAEQGWLCGTGSLFVRPDMALLHPIYLGQVVSSSSMRRYLENVAQGVTMANLNKDIVGALPIPLAPIQQQEKFAESLVAMEILRGSHNHAMQTLEILFASLQHRAFRGEL